MKSYNRSLSRYSRISIRKTYIFIGCIAIMCSLISCDDDSSLARRFVSEINMEEMAQLNLPDFSLVREGAKFYEGKEYVFVRESDATNVFITIGLHQSEIDAEYIATNYLNYISISMNEGAHQGVSIGDKFWWETGSDSNILTNIVFIEKNALFIMSSHSYDELKTLAVKIDNDILNNADFVELEKSIALPVIDSIAASQTVLRYGESSRITVYASDPNNERLEYIVVGLRNSDLDPENVFTEEATHDYVGEPFFGSHIYEFVVVNESNVVSEIVELELIISE